MFYRLLGHDFRQRVGDGLDLTMAACIAAMHHHHVDPHEQELAVQAELAKKELAEIEAEDAVAGRSAKAPRGGGRGGGDGSDKPFASRPPSASSDQRVLRRQKIMLERMRKKQSDAKEKQDLALIDPAEAENCKRYNLTVNQLRAVRRINLKLPHECRELSAAYAEEVAFNEEDVLFEEEMSLDDMFSALKHDEKFMGRQ